MVFCFIIVSASWQYEILFCCFDANWKQFMYACNTREINPTTTRSEIHYMHWWHNKFIYNSDERIQCNIDGYHKVLMRPPTHQLMNFMLIKGVIIQNLKELYFIKEAPLLDIIPCHNKFIFHKSKIKKNIEQILDSF